MGSPRRNPSPTQPYTRRTRDTLTQHTPRLYRATPPRAAARASCTDKINRLPKRRRKADPSFWSRRLAKDARVARACASTPEPAQDTARQRLQSKQSGQNKPEPEPEPELSPSTALCDSGAGWPHVSCVRDAAADATVDLERVRLRAVNNQVLTQPRWSEPCRCHERTIMPRLS